MVSTLARKPVYAPSIASLPRQERLGLGRWTLVAAGLGVCLWAALQSQWPSWRMLPILAAAGTLFYRIAQRRTQPSA